MMKEVCKRGVVDKPEIKLVTKTRDFSCGPDCFPPDCDPAHCEPPTCWPPLCYPNCSPSCSPECRPNDYCSPCKPRCRPDCQPCEPNHICPIG